MLLAVKSREKVGEATGFNLFIVCLVYVTIKRF